MSQDDLDATPIAPDTDDARWEAAYCIERDKNHKAAQQAANHLSALAVAQRALSYYAAGPDPSTALAAMNNIRALVAARADGYSPSSSPSSPGLSS